MGIYSWAGSLQSPKPPLCRHERSPPSLLILSPCFFPSWETAPLSTPLGGTKQKSPGQCSLLLSLYSTVYLETIQAATPTITGWLSHCHLLSEV